MMNDCHRMSDNMMMQEFRVLKANLQVAMDRLMHDSSEIKAQLVNLQNSVERVPLQWIQPFDIDDDRDDDRDDDSDDDSSDDDSDDDLAPQEPDTSDSTARR